MKRCRRSNGDDVTQPKRRAEGARYDRIVTLRRERRQGLRRDARKSDRIATVRLNRRNLF
jgi:hypothetical protein